MALFSFYQRVKKKLKINFIMENGFSSKGELLGEIRVISGSAMFIAIINVFFCYFYN